MYRAIVIRTLNHYWFAFRPLLVCTRTTTGSHSDHYCFTPRSSSGSHSPFSITLMLYALRRSDFTIYKNKSSPGAKASHRGSLLDWAQCRRRLLSCRDFLEDLQEVTPPEVYRLDLDTLSG